MVRSLGRLIILKSPGMFGRLSNARDLSSLHPVRRAATANVTGCRTPDAFRIWRSERCTGFRRVLRVRFDGNARPLGTALQGEVSIQNPRYDFCPRKLFRLEGGSSALFVSRSGRRRCAMPCDDGFDRIPGLFGVFWPRLHRPHHQVGASEGENAALVIMTLLA